MMLAIIPLFIQTMVKQGRTLMTTVTTSESILNIQADAVVVGISGNTLSGAASELNEVTKGGLQSLIDSKKAKTAAGKVLSLIHI